MAFDLGIVLLHDCLWDLIGYFVTGLLWLWIWIFCYRIECGIWYEYFVTGFGLDDGLTGFLHESRKQSIP